MGKLDFLKAQPLSPIEAVVGLSAIARGLYLFIATLTQHTALLTSGSTAYDLFLGILFVISGIILLVGVVKDKPFTRAAGLITVGAGTVVVIAKTITVGEPTVTSLLGNITMLTVAIGLLLLLIGGDRE